MLQAKDLRIGNYIMQGGKITCVEKLSRSIDDWDRTNGVRTQDCQPIPLTKDWMLEFGFKLEAVGSEFRGHNIILHNWLLDREYVSWGTIKLKYVHELQNLYFAITKTELLKGVNINIKY